MYLLLLFINVWRAALSNQPDEIDTNGYVMYCPCMGRFGNQAEQFLGAISFAKGLNRTLALPAWVTYPQHRPFESLQIPFDDWFKVGPLKEYHVKVITMEYFMEQFASRIWPVGRRQGFCYQFRDQKTACSMKDGNPFGPFWSHYSVDFDSSVTHTGLLWDTSNEYTRSEWLRRFPASEYPVMAFQGPPGAFPSLPSHQYIHQYIEFSDRILLKANRFIREVMNNKKYVAIHLRNGIDLTRVCDELDKYGSLFASKQCTDHTLDKKLTHMMCNPSKQEIVKKVKMYIKKSQAEALFIATDNDSMYDVFKKELRRMKVSIHRREGTNDVEDPIIDIALLSKSDFFIGNCVSTFSAFVRRHREDFNNGNP